MGKRNQNKPSSPADRVLSKDSSFAVREAYKTLRTNLEFSFSQTGSKALLFTSTSQGEGKSTSCLNAAITFGEAGFKTVLIDCDLRRPNVGPLLGLNHREGLSSLLTGHSQINDMLIPTAHPNLDVIVSGRIPPNPAELLSGDAMGELVERLKSYYDYVFLDAPPIGVVTDGMVLSRYADGVVLVVRENVTDKKMLQITIGQLQFAKAKIIGFLYNDAVMEGKGLSKYYGRYYGK